MSETAIFIVGVVIFAITIYGSVMAAGLALTRHELDENPALKRAAESNSATPASPFDTKY